MAAFSLVVSGPSGTGLVCGASASAAAPEFIPPVDGQVVRHFEPPPAPYASGHRGIDYAVSAGTEVLASGDGTVSFAGPVADDGLFVTIRHRGVIETTYSFLSQVIVEAGMEVHQGQPIALSGEGHPDEGFPVLHFGARVGGQYFDPEILLFGDLDDVSNLISLAPFEDGAVYPALNADDSSFEERKHSSNSRFAKGFFPTLGRKIGTLIGSVARGPGKAASWIGDKARSFWSFIKRVAHGAGAGLSAAYHRTGRFFSRVGDALASAARRAGGFISKVAEFGKSAAKRGWDIVLDLARMAVNAAKAAGRFVVRMIQTVIRVAKEVAEFIGNFARVARKALGVVVGSASLLEHAAVFTVGMGKGAIEQIRCSREGGAPPPKLPTKQQLARGATPPPPPNDNIVVAVAGIGSSTTDKADGTVKANASIYEMDFRTLGYSRDQVFYFSYKGLEDRGAGGPYALHAAYSKEDTYQSIRDAALLLRRQIEEIHARHPDKDIDIVAHSQGGLLAQAYIADINSRNSGQDVRIRHLVTIGTPHLGADSAAIGQKLSDTTRGKARLEQLDSIAKTLGLPPATSESAIEMAEESSFVQEMQGKWDPGTVDTTTIAGTFDLVVTPQHTRLKGSRQFTADMPGESWWKFPIHHGAIVEAQSTKEILYNALSDTPSKCTALRDAFADFGPGRIVSELEDTAVGLIDIEADLPAWLGR